MIKQKHNTHVVFKIEDAQKYLNFAENGVLALLLRKIDTGRIADGKKINTYAICNADEPYYKNVLNAILLGETEKECAAQAENGGKE